MYIIISASTYMHMCSVNTVTYQKRALRSMRHPRKWPTPNHGHTGQSKEMLWLLYNRCVAVLTSFAACTAASFSRKVLSRSACLMESEGREGRGGEGRGGEGRGGEEGREGVGREERGRDGRIKHDSSATQCTMYCQKCNYMYHYMCLHVHVHVPPLKVALHSLQAAVGVC